MRFNFLKINISGRPGSQVNRFHLIKPFVLHYLPQEG